MKEETIVQLMGVIIVAILTIFYNPINADFQGKIIFFGIILSLVIFYSIWNLYELIKKQKLRIDNLTYKLSIEERIKRLECLLNKDEKKVK